MDAKPRLLSVGRVLNSKRFIPPFVCQPITYLSNSERFGRKCNIKKIYYLPVMQQKYMGLILLRKAAFLRPQNLPATKMLKRTEFSFTKSTSSTTWRMRLPGIVSGDRMGPPFIAAMKGVRPFVKGPTTLSLGCPKTITMVLNHVSVRHGSPSSTSTTPKNKTPRGGRPDGPAAILISWGFFGEGRAILGKDGSSLSQGTRTGVSLTYVYPWHWPWYLAGVLRDPWGL